MAVVGVSFSSLAKMAMWQMTITMTMNDTNIDDDNDVDDDIVKDGNGHLMAEVGLGVR